ncbi:MAG: hypothetical protein SFU91_04205 [Chloroherpetonaceae bacterium]|nr:hypothetical protein [Chloroherpetonaceae bacterium]
MTENKAIKRVVEPSKPPCREGGHFDRLNDPLHFVIPAKNDARQARDAARPESVCPSPERVISSAARNLGTSTHQRFLTPLRSVRNDKKLIQYKKCP